MSLDSTLGAVFIGSMVAAVLFGFTCVQTWYYFTHYPSDSWYIKTTAAFVLISDTIHQVLITHMIYTYSVTDFGVYSALQNVTWSLDIQVIFNAFTTLFVQCFLVMRIYMLSNKNKLLSSFAMCFVLGEFITSIIFTFESLPLKTYTEFATLNALSKTVNVLSAVADLVIAGILCVLLHISRTGLRRSETMITKLMLFSINTGLLTSLCAWGSLISITVWPNAWIYIGFYFCIGRLYSNTLLATLNARKGLRRKTFEDISLSLPNPTAQQKASQITRSSTSRNIPSNISIKIDTTRECIQDEQFISLGGDVKTAEAV